MLQITFNVHLFLNVKFRPFPRGKPPKRVAKELHAEQKSYTKKNGCMIEQRVAEELHVKKGVVKELYVKKKN